MGRTQRKLLSHTLLQMQGVTIIIVITIRLLRVDHVPRTLLSTSHLSFNLILTTTSEGMYYLLYKQGNRGTEMINHQSKVELLLSGKVVMLNL